MNLDPLLRRLTIRDKDRNLTPLVPNFAQRQILDQIEKDYENGKPSRIIVLKARRLGISTLAEALCYLWALMFPATNSAVIAHDREATQYLLEMTRLFHDTFPLKDAFPLRYQSKRHMQFKDSGSNIWVMAADNVDAARSRTLHAAHLSEVAFWNKPTETMMALMQTIPHRPGTLVILESTANGVGNWWWDRWYAAERGEFDYTPMFFPWHADPELIPCQGAVCKNQTCKICVESAAGVKKLDLDEKKLEKIGVTRAQLAWRRWALRNPCMGSLDILHQEYPATAEESFLATGVNAFPENSIRACFEPCDVQTGRLIRDDTAVGGVKFIADHSGPLRVYKAPSGNMDWGNYFVGADACHGSISGDFAAAQVINRHNKEQVAVWHGRINPISYADELAMLGSWYNQAMICPEVSGPGYATAGRLSGIYPHIWQHKVADRNLADQHSVAIGWLTDWKRKTWMIMKTAEMIERQQVILHDRKTFDELKAYVYLEDKDLFAPASRDLHDDLVMALGIALVAESTEPAPRPYENREGPGDSSARGIILGEKVSGDEYGDDWS